MGCGNTEFDVKRESIFVEVAPTTPANSENFIP